IREDPHWVLPVLAAGITYLQAGDPKAAAAVFGRARELAPDDYRSYYLRATAMGRSNPGPAERTEMIADLRQAVALNPRQARVRTALGQALISSDAPAAEAQLREALRIDPAEPSALYQLGLLSRRQGKTAEAERLSRAFQAARAKSREDENELVWILKTPK
ncbi:MAG TPA: tetratricopeptide repeat protein, partial [Bryobacteraceae bacterium]|nr:tetratricopeptide repeat protein [Bryobacteraceae bacterium]